MRCQAHRPGDIVQCEQPEGHDGQHSAMPRRNSPTHAGQATLITWDKTWFAPPIDPAYLEHIRLARASNVAFGAVLEELGIAERIKLEMAS